MYSRIFLGAVAFLASAGGVHGQTDQMRATYRAPDDRNQGKCTVDLVVDGAVDVEIRGDSVYLRNLSGQPARGRRFVCTGPVPQRPVNFRFDPQEGRGKQTLLRDPREGGPIVVHIEDPQSGSDGYKFDIYWDASAGPGPANQGPGFDRDRDHQRDRGPDGPNDRDDRGYPNYRDQDDYHRDRDRWQGQDWQQRLFDRVRQDVDHVRGAYQSDDDQRRLSRVIQELNELQDKMAQGRYDRGELDDVIEWLQRVVRENRLPRRDGQLLSDDLDRLRDYRSRQDENGGR